jgi:hypothetical protein
MSFPLYIIPAKAGIQWFFLGSCFRRNDMGAPSPGGAFGTAAFGTAGLSRHGRGDLVSIG